ncbi:hypothetical protein Y032_0076g1070 [Ancylostoma ceylanicum]|uniref:Tc1-like transposase DDE domain-containing protein n=1 Tax=Ancylostoma ceylanicum TaxID=53326 RepID=A0A016TVQ1_9BILA|nr:hypothetical protein Y032_0076g1070 [Ancylostoma ceylanicum]
MASKQGWNDTNISRFPSAATIQEYPCGKTSGTSRGKRGIVMGALKEYLIPQCSRVLISGDRHVHDDYHHDMDSVVFEEWLRTSIPLVHSFANSRHVTVIMDNASYHSRVLEEGKLNMT